MTTLPRKAFFERQASGYPADDSIAYARILGCDSVALLAELADADKVARARAAGLRWWWWAGPDAWKPATWRNTHDRIVALLSTLGGEGYIADVETADAWRGHDVQRAELVAALDRDSAAASVGFTSFPSWPWWREVAWGARRVWGCPQLYGIHSPAPPMQLRARGEPWRQAFGGGYCPALAAWGRTAPELAAYLGAFADMPGAVFWHSLPAPRGAELEVLRQWSPAASSGRGLLWLLIAVLAMQSIESSGR